MPKTYTRPFGVIPLLATSIASSTSNSARPPLHLLQHQHAGMLWQTDGSATAFVRVDLGSAQEIDFVALLQCSAAAGTQIRVRMGDSQAEVDGVAPYDSGTVNFIDPAVTRKSGLYHSHLELGSAETRQWLRIDLSGLPAVFTASQLVFGKKIAADTFYSPNWEMGIDDLGELDIGRNGVANFALGRVMRTVRIPLPWIDEIVYEEGFRYLFETMGTTRPFYVCFDPTADAYRQNRTYFGWFKDKPFATGGKKAGKLEMELSVMSQI